jgi:hypothetical protein
VQADSLRTQSNKAIDNALAANKITPADAQELRGFLCGYVNAWDVRIGIHLQLTEALNQGRITVDDYNRIKADVQYWPFWWLGTHKEKRFSASLLEV